MGPQNVFRIYWQGGSVRRVILRNYLGFVVRCHGQEVFFSLHFFSCFSFSLLFSSSFHVSLTLFLYQISLSFQYLLWFFFVVSGRFIRNWWWKLSVWCVLLLCDKRTNSKKFRFSPFSLSLSSDWPFFFFFFFSLSSFYFNFPFFF